MKQFLPVCGMGFLQNATSHLCQKCLDFIFGYDSTRKHLSTLKPK